MTYVVFFVLVAVIVFLGVFVYEMERLHQGERDMWKLERKELYDRIQAPSFSEYKQGEVKMMKAQKEEKPVPTYQLE
ncbi:hypothetical protein CN581_14465 [Bacillus toyonensis]|uniref:hypothetical protein n=1 Tax=Bacillus toyonensis TaxID=155322 RepID=UPI000BF45588|nr:hypothetical protein [Bacillus toyonensis]PEP80695.1 hypothetical protein CN581_14465 [Bacillus toyonensis]